jgi:hypothetical protein
MADTAPRISAVDGVDDPRPHEGRPAGGRPPRRRAAVRARTGSRTRTIDSGPARA